MFATLISKIVLKRFRVYAAGIISRQHFQDKIGLIRRGSVLENLTRDQGVAGLSLTGGTVLCPYPLLRTGSSKEDPS